MTDGRRDAWNFFYKTRKESRDKWEIIETLAQERDTARSNAIDFTIDKHKRLYNLEYGYQLYVLIQKLQKGEIAV